MQITATLSRRLLEELRALTMKSRLGSWVYSDPSLGHGLPLETDLKYFALLNESVLI